MKRKSVTRLLAVALSGAMLLSSSPVAYAMEEQYQENTIDDNNSPNIVPSEPSVEPNVGTSTGDDAFLEEDIDIIMDEGFIGGQGTENTEENNLSDGETFFEGDPDGELFNGIIEDGFIDSVEYYGEGDMENPEGPDIIDNEYGTYIDGGNCGATEEDTLKWAVYDNNSDTMIDVLVISGTGKMQDYEMDYNCAPWKQYVLTGSVKLFLNNGVESIGNNAFAYCEGLTGNALLPDSLTNIGCMAFQSCAKLVGTLVIPESVTNIEYDAFSGCGYSKAVIKNPSCNIYSGRWTLASNKIYGYENSTAQSYAEYFGLEFYKDHSYEGRITNPCTDTEDGLITYKCLICGHTYETTIPAGEKMVVIDDVNFPDDSFRRYITEKIDIDDNGYLSEEEIQSVTRICIGYEYEVNDFTGIKHFPYLKSFYAGWHEDIKKIDLSGMYNLEEVFIEPDDGFDPDGTTEILDLSNDKKLAVINCRRRSINEINLSGCNSVKILGCSGNNLSQLDVAGMMDLERLECDGNHIGYLDLRNKKNLRILRCNDNDLSGLDISDCDKLEHIDCGNNHIPVLDLRNQFSLQTGNTINAQTSDAKVFKASNGWAVNIKELVGNGNTDLVQLQKNWWMGNDGYAIYDGEKCPEYLYYSYKTQCPSEYLNLSVKVGLIEGSCLHNYLEEVKGPTCTEYGAQYLKCSICGHIGEGSSKEIPKKGHDWDNWKQVVAPTMKSEGQEQRVCKACGTKEMRTIAKLPLELPKAVLGTPEVVSGDHAKVSWNPVDGADGYAVYRSTGNGWQKIATVSGSISSYTDTNTKIGTKYAYSVRAYAVVDGKTIYSPSNKPGVSITQGFYKDAVKMSYAKTLSTKSVKIKWSGRKKSTGYIIYRKTPGGSWKKLATVGKVSSYTDKTCKPATTYQYAVKAYAKAGSKMVYSKMEKTGAVAVTKMLTPKLTVKSTTKRTASLSWTKQSNVGGYVIYRKEGSSGAWEKIKRTSAKASSYKDKGLKSKQTYYYIVKAYKKAIPSIGITEPTYSGYSKKKVKIK